MSVKFVGAFKFEFRGAFILLALLNSSLDER